MVTAFNEGIGSHRPLILESAQDIMRNTFIRHDDSVDSTGAWPAANRALLVKVRNPRPFTPSHAYVFNGNAVAGNLDIGVYGFTARTQLELLISTGATAQAGISEMQMIALTAPVQLPAGDLVLALSLANTGGRTSKRNTLAALTYYERLIGLAQRESAHPLPASISSVTAPTSGINDPPIFGVMERLF